MSEVRAFGILGLRDLGFQGLGSGLWGLGAKGLGFGVWGVEFGA